MSNSHTKFGWILSNGLGVDSMNVGRTEAIAISPLLFLKIIGINIGFEDRLSLISGQKYCKMLKGTICH